MKGLRVLALGLLLAAPVAALDFGLGFSPEGTALQQVLSAIASAKQTVVVAAYSFTSTEVAQALAAAVRRGVKVWMVIDDGAAKSPYSQAAYLAQNGVAVRTDNHHAIFHNKYMIVDSSTVETGSFNYTSSADKRNAENALVLRGVPELAKAYLDEWVHHWDESTALVMTSQGRLK
jgi:phosphatidylserine/phosphatidylglycerophosphate/cardiolipin synthase-like enzyme